MPSCVFKHCKHCSQKQKKTEGISFHRLPADPFLHEEWVSIIRKSREDNNWRPSKFCVICSSHFKDEDVYFSEKGRRLLKKRAKPTQSLYASVPSSESSDAGSKGLRFPLQLPELCNENHPIDLEMDSDVKSIFGTIQKSRRKESRKHQLLRVVTKRKLKILKVKLHCFKKRNSSLKNILIELKDKNFVNCDTYNLLCDNVIATELFHSLYVRSYGKKKLKHSSAMRKFCLTLNFYSPKGYEYVRKTFNTCLPHPKTLSEWYTHKKSKPGFTQEAFFALAKMAEVSPHKLIGALMIDEMALHQQKLWDGKRYIGVVDMGDEITESTALASQAFVFMLVGVNQSFKVPLGYFLINNLTGEQKANLIKLCLMKCHEAGVKVVSLTFDEHFTNFTAMEILGCSITDVTNLKTTFLHPSDSSEVACFLDPSRAIKLLRNQLEAKKQLLNKDGKLVDWNYIVKLNKLQEDEGLHLAKKLTKRHFLFRDQIMNVKLASQMLSRSVAKAMHICREDYNIPDFENSQPTEEFIQLMNDMFDIFNTSATIHFDYRKPLYKGNKETIYKTLETLQEYIGSLQIKNITKQEVIKDGRRTFVIKRFFKKAIEVKCKPGFLGTLMNISSLKSLYERLIEKDKCLVFLPTYKLSQDHLEIFFGCVRMSSGHNDNPNVKQFKGIYSKLLTHLESGICVPIENVTILTCSSAIQIINSTSPSYRHEDTDNTEEITGALNFLKDIPEDVDNLAQLLDVPIFNDTRRVIVGYIAGSVVYYTKKVIKCECCISHLVSTERQDFHKLIGLSNKGGLVFPSTDTFEVCSAAETIIRKFVKEKIVIKTQNDYKYVTLQILKGFIGNHKTFRKLEDEHQFYGVEHKVSLLKIVIEQFLNIRLHYISKLEANGRIRCMDARRQYFRKLV